MQSRIVSALKKRQNFYGIQSFSIHYCYAHRKMREKLAISIIYDEICQFQVLIAISTTSPIISAIIFIIACPIGY